MESVDVDILAMCIGRAGQSCANVAAHVSRVFLEATRSVWRGGWRTGAASCCGSRAQFAWCESVGLRLDGRALLRAAARLGAMDLLSTVAPLYVEWDAGATAAAAAADQLDVILAFDPAPEPRLLYAAGPRVRAHFERLPGVEFLDPERDFRRLMRDVVPVDAVEPRSLEEAQAHLRHLTWSRRVTRETQTFVPPGRYCCLGVMARLPPVDIVYDVQPSWGTIRNICRFTTIGTLVREPYEPDRKWFVSASSQSMWLEIETDYCAAPMELTFTALFLPRHLRETASYSCWSDDRVVYDHSAGLEGGFEFVYHLEDTPLGRRDGRAHGEPILVSKFTF